MAARHSQEQPHFTSSLSPSCSHSHPAPPSAPFPPTCDQAEHFGDFSWKAPPDHEQDAAAAALAARAHLSHLPGSLQEPVGQHSNRGSCLLSTLAWPLLPGNLSHFQPHRTPLHVSIFLLGFTNVMLESTERMGSHH